MSADQRPRVLALVQLPPPVHGAALSNRITVESPLLNAAFRIETTPIQLSTSMADIGIGGWRKIGRIARNCWRFLRASRRARPDLVYFTLPPTGGGFYANLPLVAVAKLAGAPLLYHFRTKGVAEEAAASPLFRRLFAWAMRDAHVILLSERLYPDVAGFVPSERVFVVPNGVSPVLDALPEPRANDRPDILFLSNLMESKGPLVLLDALAQLKKRGATFRATFAGAPHGRVTSQFFEAELLRNCLAEDVRYVGFVSGEGKDALLKSADIFAFPTKNEAFPRCVLEAMGAGLAVVATPVGAIPDMLRDGVNGLIVRHGDSGALADALQRLIEDPDMRQRMGREGWRIVTTEYSPQMFEARMRDAWLATIRGAPISRHFSPAPNSHPPQTSAPGRGSGTRGVAARS